MSIPRIPNILVTGTPGTGKTTLAADAAQATGWEHINVGDLVKSDSLHHGWDEEFECWTLDEDKVRFVRHIATICHDLVYQTGIPTRLLAQGLLSPALKSRAFITIISLAHRSMLLHTGQRGFSSVR